MEGSSYGVFGLFCLDVKFLNNSRQNTGNFNARKQFVRICATDLQSHVVETS